MIFSRKKSSSFERGLTLIELLVVVSIISLLSSIVLASLRESRGKAQDSKVVSQLLEMRSVAELNNSGSSYGIASGENNCGTLDDVFTNAKFNDTGNWPVIDGYIIAPVCYSNAAGDGDMITAFSVWNNLNNSSGWCVDSEGSSVRLDSAPYNHVCTPGGSGSVGTTQDGDSCSLNSDCLSGFCGYLDGPGNPQICTDGSSNYLCTNNDQCVYFCDSSSRCAGPNNRSEGDPCSDNYNCLSNSCNPLSFVCDPDIVLTETGGYCEYNEQCTSGYCTNSTCTDTNKLTGESCLDGYECSSGICDSGTLTCF